MLSRSRLRESIFLLSLFERLLAGPGMNLGWGLASFA